MIVPACCSYAINWWFRSCCGWPQGVKILIPYAPAVKSWIPFLCSSIVKAWIISQENSPLNFQLPKLNLTKGLDLLWNKPICDGWSDRGTLVAYLASPWACPPLWPSGLSWWGGVRPPLSTLSPHCDFLHMRSSLELSRLVGHGANRAKEESLRDFCKVFEDGACPLRCRIFLDCGQVFCHEVRASFTSADLLGT